MTEIEKLEHGLAALEGQRATLGDVVVDALLAPVREKLAALRAQAPPVASAPPAPQQRKHVTVLFADVSGFTALAEALDAEDVAATMNTLWQRLDAIIATHGGKVDKHIGDAVMAVWGTETAREDDPEQAIKAALAMQAVVKDETSSFRLHLSSLQIRIGLNTGPVLLGAVGSVGEFTVMGDTVNVAARLEHAAPVGGILVSHDTYRHVRGVFDVFAQLPLSVKGKTEPLQVYLIERLKPRAFRVGTRGVEGIETRTIGREGELAQLQTTWSRTLLTQQAQAALVIGEAGVGKSRLLHELLTWMEARENLADWHGYAEKRFRLFQGRLSAEHQHLPYALFRDVFMTRFKILESDNPLIIREKLTRGIVELMPEDAQAALKAQFIGQVLGFDCTTDPEVRAAIADPKQIRDRAFLYTEQFLATVSQQSPIVWLLEDLHWADEDSLTWLESLLRATTHLPLFVVAVARPALLERRPTWPTDSPLFPVQMTLQPLTDADSRALVAEILRQVPALPAILRELIVSRAEGNPFYVEEFIKMLIDQKVLLPDPAGGPWQVAVTRLAEAAVPPTLTGVLQARLDRLSPAERLTLQRAAVIGRIFWEHTLQALTDAAALPVPLATHLTALHQREFIFPRTASAFAATTEYVFKHALLQEVTYETVLKPQRRAYHAQVARWFAARLEEQATGRAEGLAGLVAEHYEKAGQLAEAAQWYGRAGEAAQAAYANTAAQTHYTRQLALLTDPGSQTETLLKLGTVQEQTGQWAAAEAQYQAALTHAEVLGARTTIARCQQALGVVARLRGDYAIAIQWLTQAETQWAALHDQRRLGQIYNELSIVHWRQGDYALAVALAHQSLALARTVADPPTAAWAFNTLGAVAYFQGQFAEAQTFFTESLALRRAQGDKLGITASLNNLGLVAGALGDYATGQDWHTESLALKRELGDKQGITASLNNLGLAAMEQGDFATAQTLHTESLALKRELGDKPGIATSLNNLGVLALVLGNPHTAQALHEESLALRQALGDKRGTAMSHFNLGVVAVEERNYTLAEAYLVDSLQTAHALGEKRQLVLNLIGQAAVAAGVGATARAAQLVAAAQALTQRLNSPLSVFHRQLFERTLTTIRAALSETVFQAAWAVGEQMTLDEAVAYALAAHTPGANSVG